MLTIYNVIYTKPEWTRENALAHLGKNGVKLVLQCEENDKCCCFTIKQKDAEDTKDSRFIPLTDSVGLIIKDLELPEKELPETEDASVSLDDGSC
jgi:hypothetical protein